MSFFVNQNNQVENLRKLNFELAAKVQAMEAKVEAMEAALTNMNAILNVFYRSIGETSTSTEAYTFLEVNLAPGIGPDFINYPS